DSGVDVRGVSAPAPGAARGAVPAAGGGHTAGRRPGAAPRRGHGAELLLLLDEYWEAHPELAAVPIYQASGQMRKGMRVYETYVEMMNDDIKAVFQHHNPFAFRHVTHLKSAAHFDDVGPCVLMATPSGLQSGASRDAFEAWCEDKRNTVIICDFAVQGTLAREILGGPKDIVTRTGYRVSALAWKVGRPLPAQTMHGAHMAPIYSIAHHLPSQLSRFIQQ
ncbi:uncharacterized protein HaLaN_18738, partial [Haematococcus lacustris]